SKFGAEFLTYVLWVVTPDGRSGNTGEILIDKDGEGKRGASTPAQTFSMIVTAEPYFAVRVPSEVVILENDTRKSTKGQIFPINDFFFQAGDGIRDRNVTGVQTCALPI